MTISRRNLLLGLTATGLAPAVGAQGISIPGVTSTEIKIGITLPLSGPAAAYGAVGKAIDAHFAMVNDAGGINGRKLRLFQMDDGYSPNRTIEQTRRLVEQEGVLMMVGQVGTPTALAARKYLNEAKVPQLFIGSGGSPWADELEQNPWSLAWSPSYRIEGRTVARHILATRPAAKVGVLYQNDDAGKGFLQGLVEGLAGKSVKIVRQESAEATDPSVDSQVIALQTSGADVMASFNIPKATAQAIRRAVDLQWKAQIYIGSVSASVPQVLVPAGLEKAKGVISCAYLKDPADPSWSADKGMQEFRAVMKAKSPNTPLDSLSVSGVAIGMATEQLLRQCGADLSRENVLKQTMRLDMDLPLLLPGIRISTSATQRSLFSAMRLQQFDGSRWVLLPQS